MQLSEERAVERDDLAETFADTLFSVEVTKGNVFVTLGVVRVDHRFNPPKRSETPVVRLVLPHLATRNLSVALRAAVENLDKALGDLDRGAITLPRPPTN